jgi:hypothetical protein
MKRLFEVVKADGTKLEPRAFYDIKYNAKVARDRIPGQMIIRGPDHERFRGRPVRSAKK